MSKELRTMRITMTVNDPDDLPVKDGEQMYAADVVTELRDAVEAFVASWYSRRGVELLACEPLVF